MRKTSIVLLLAFITAGIPALAQQKTSVYIISTLHGLHKTNLQYTYDSLFAFIDRLNPDVVAVEIRPEDMNASTNYLKSNYPYEMYECISRYKNKTVLGIDWLGKDIEGIAIAPNYWREVSAIKKMQQQLNEDSNIVKKLSILTVVTNQKMTIAKSSSLVQLNDGRYDVANHIYYQQLKQLLQSTPYEGIAEFYETRDKKIAANIISIINNNKGKKLLFLVGADHRDFANRQVQQALGDAVILNPLPKE